MSKLARMSIAVVCTLGVSAAMAQTVKPGTSGQGTAAAIAISTSAGSTTTHY